MEDAEDVVERAAVHRVARVRGVDERRQALDGRKVDGEGDDFGARHHHLVRLLVGEVEDLVEHLLLGLLDHAVVLGLGDDVADVLLRVGEDARRRRLDPEEA